MEMSFLRVAASSNYSLCSRPFKAVDVAHSGYAADGKVLFLGGYCEAKITETVASYDWEPRAYDL